MKRIPNVKLIKMCNGRIDGHTFNEKIHIIRIDCLNKKWPEKLTVCGQYIVPEDEPTTKKATCKACLKKGKPNENSIKKPSAGAEIYF